MATHSRETVNIRRITETGNDVDKQATKTITADGSGDWRRTAELKTVDDWRQLTMTEDDVGPRTAMYDDDEQRLWWRTAMMTTDSDDNDGQRWCLTTVDDGWRWWMTTNDGRRRRNTEVELSRVDATHSSRTRRRNEESTRDAENIIRNIYLHENYQQRRQQNRTL